MAEDLERKRAEFALERVKSWLDGGPRGKKIGERLPGLPVMLRTQGLLITDLTLRAKEASELAETIAAWLTREAPHSPLKSDRADADFQVLCTSAPRTAYVAAQWEAIAFAQTLKLVAEGVGLSKQD